VKLRKSGSAQISEAKTIQQKEVEFEDVSGSIKADVVKLLVSSERTNAKDFFEHPTETSPLYLLKCKFYLPLRRLSCPNKTPYNELGTHTYSKLVP
jgi:hypothetical protein